MYHRKMNVTLSHTDNINSNEKCSVATLYHWELIYINGNAELEVAKNMRSPSYNWGRQEHKRLPRIWGRQATIEVAKNIRGRQVTIEVAKQQYRLYRGLEVGSLEVRSLEKGSLAKGSLLFSFLWIRDNNTYLCGKLLEMQIYSTSYIFFAAYP